MRLASLECSIALAFVLSADAAPVSAWAASDDGNIITLSTSRDIAEAESVNRAIDGMAAAAATCRKTTSWTPLQCECSSSTDLASLRAAYATAVTRHPGWASPGRTVWWIDPKSKHSIGVNFSAVARVVDLCGMK